MSVLSNARKAVRKIGLDVQRWPDPNSPNSHRARIARLLEAHGVTTVLDVGANIGRYSASLRDEGYSGRIVSFEPVDAQWHALEMAASADPLWDTVRCALGATDDLVTINVAANVGRSSSILPMTGRHRDAAPLANYVSSEQVQQHRLDDLAGALALGDYERTFIKLDVQGYERAVLDGAPKVLAGTVGVQLELSLTPLYEGEMLYREALDFLGAQGFNLRMIEPGFVDPKTGEDLQIDGIFFRD